jgi:DNA repair and recombination protein RAD52
VTAVVKVMLKDGTYHEDVGYGMAEHPKKGSAIENAKKVLTSILSRRCRCCQ